GYQGRIPPRAVQVPERPPRQLRAPERGPKGLPRSALLEPAEQAAPLLAALLFGLLALRAGPARAAGGGWRLGRGGGLLRHARCLSQRLGELAGRGEALLRIA